MRKIFICISALVLSGCINRGSKVLTDVGGVVPQYNIYFGSTHAHSNYSGDIAKLRAQKGLRLDPKNTAENHFKLAKENGYQFYSVTDHSQYEVYSPEAFADIKRQAERFTDGNFVGIRGYEHSENNGPDGTGHINVYNSDRYLNALADGVSLAYFNNWLAKNKNRKVIACFNHPQENSYNNFYCYNETARKKITLIELINGKNSKYPAFVNALSKGWKVSPVAGCDNHGIEGIARWEARTGIAAETLTYNAIMEAMAAGRTYATFDKNLKLLYYVNDKPMGSVLSKENSLKFSIEISDPDVLAPDNVITKIEIIGENGKVIALKTFDEHAIRWTIIIPAKERYYYLKVYNASMEEPVAYAAPVWIEY